MTTNFEIEMCLSDTDVKNIRETGSVRLTVKWTDETRHKKDFYHCLFCNTSFCRSGMYYHRFRCPPDPGSHHDVADTFLSEPRRQQMIIRAEFERRFDNGRLRRVPIERPSPNYAFDFVPVATPLLPNQTPPTRRQRQVQLLQDVDVFQQDEPLPERMVEDQVPDRYPNLMDCFSSDGFDSKCFGEFASIF